MYKINPLGKYKHINTVAAEVLEVLPHFKCLDPIQGRILYFGEVLRPIGFLQIEGKSIDRIRELAITRHKDMEISFHVLELNSSSI